MPKCAPPARSPPGTLLVTSLFVLASAAAPGCRDSTAGGVRPKDASADVTDSAAHDAVTEVYCPADGPGGGVCPINFCGYIKSSATLGVTETAQAGADSLCNQGRICLATQVVASGDAIQLSCQSPQAGGLAYGAACSKDTASTQRCKDDSLCIAGPGGSGATFCTTLCRIDADCPAGSACLEYPQPLPNNSNAMVGECTPVTSIPGTICTSEGACPAGQGCVLYGARTMVRTCKAGGTKSLGEACTAPAQCRSGECYDRNFGIGSTANRALCSGVCARNSDCGMNQRCVVEVVGNNGTIDDPLDDVAVGYCRSLFSATIGSACQNSNDCVTQGKGADTCDPNYGVCYKASAVIGGSCAADDGCGLGQTCALGPTFARGACVLQGCAPAGATGHDVCPGASSTCSQRMSDEPLYRCYEGCATAGGCSRQADNYFCAPAQTGQSISICLSR
jgi:hypothetical protein